MTMPPYFLLYVAFFLQHRVTSFTYSSPSGSFSSTFTAQRFPLISSVKQLDIVATSHLYQGTSDSESVPDEGVEKQAKTSGNVMNMESNIANGGTDGENNNIEIKTESIDDYLYEDEEEDKDAERDSMFMLQAIDLARSL